ncbi:MAG: galactose-1-phosphate uridylyltransferase, partial [Oscillospiraceae bacterium]|nr:galactose-1-phosphate uridylyltransferase [Oscillospiraceae bacterium]
KEKLISLASLILDSWKEYSDEEVDIISHTKNIPHNAVTPISRINKDGKYEFDIVLRNNRTTDEYPYGIFHPHEDLHHIKKENIGLIEVMGLAILPGRLAEDFKKIEKVLEGKIEFDPAVLGEYSDWTNDLLSKYGNKNSKEGIINILKKETGLVFLRVLQDAGVFKFTEKGKMHFHNFMNHMGFFKI